VAADFLARPGPLGIQDELRENTFAMRRTLLRPIAALALLGTTSSASADRAQPEPDEVADEQTAPAQGDAETYRVRAGDTLSGIAGQLGVTLDELLQHNPELNPDRIREGQRLVIRDGRLARPFARSWRGTTWSSAS
jgi:hypothetical protein